LTTHRLLWLALAAILLLPACGSAPKTVPEKFTLAGQEVEFSAPPATWTKKVQEIPKSWDMVPSSGPPGQKSQVRELPGGTVVRFTPSWPDGHLTVSAIADWGMTSWAEDPEKTQAHVTHLHEQILKRSEGRISRQAEEKLDAATSLRLEFEYRDGVREMKGLQVHAIHQGHYWTVALLCPAENFAEAAPVFESLVKSFKFL